MAVNKAPDISKYPGAMISVSGSANGRPVADYSAGNMQSYKYIMVRKPVSLSENPTVSEIEAAVDTIKPDDLDSIDAVIAEIHSLDAAGKVALKTETIEKLDQILLEATNIKLIEELSVTPAGVISNKQLKQARIRGALLASGLDTNDFNATVKFIVTQTKTEEGSAATFVGSLVVDGQEVGLQLPVTLKIGLPPEYFPLGQDQIHLTGNTGSVRSAFMARAVRLAGGTIDKWLNFTYNGADNTANFQTDALGTFNLIRKGSTSGRGGKRGGSGPSNGQWMKDATGWWYQYTDQTYPRDGWFQLGYAGQNEWYYFDPNGYMVTGWVLSNGKWYYLNPAADGTQGKMLTGWQLIDGKWYYLNENPDGTKGARFMDTWIGEYFVNQEGVWEKDKKKQ